MPRLQKPRTEAGPRRTGGGKFIPKRRVCPLCADKVKTMDYKDANRLRRFISDRGKIEPRRKTSACAKHQRVISLAIKRARLIALLPYTPSHIRKGGTAVRAAA